MNTGQCPGRLNRSCTEVGNEFRCLCNPFQFGRRRVCTFPQVVCVPGTPAMVVFVLFYKLAERGESLLPLHLVDKGVPLSSLALWTGPPCSLDQDSCSLGVKSCSLAITPSCLAITPCRCCPLPGISPGLSPGRLPGVRQRPQSGQDPVLQLLGQVREGSSCVWLFSSITLKHFSSLDGPILFKSL